MRELWWMARGAWQPMALLAAIMAMPEEGAEPSTTADFNPFLAGREKDKTRHSNLQPYDPQHLQRLQDNM